MDELDVFETLERLGVVLVSSDEGLVLCIKKSMLTKLLEIASKDEDEQVFMLIQEAETGKDRTGLN